MILKDLIDVSEPNLIISEGGYDNPFITLHDKEFTLEDFSCEHCPAFINGVIETLEAWRELYLETKDKKYWYAIIQLLPSSYNQRRTITLNYEVLYNIYGSRRNHKLDEWSIGFMEWIESLPYSKLITDRS